jgi:PAS domain-containing protein
MVVRRGVPEGPAIDTPILKRHFMTNTAEKQPEPDLPASLVMVWYPVTLSAIGDAVLTTDSEGRITYMNPAGRDAHRMGGGGGPRTALGSGLSHPQ